AKGQHAGTTVQLLPAPASSGIVASPTVKDLLRLAGIQDCYVVSSSGKPSSPDCQAMATYAALRGTRSPALSSSSPSSLSVSMTRSSSCAVHTPVTCPYDQYTDYIFNKFRPTASGPRNRPPSSFRSPAIAASSSPCSSSASSSSSSRLSQGNRFFFS
ncbi:unnamed protein product, partial [Notodromas monacha]